MLFLTEFRNYGGHNLVSDVFIECGTFQGTSLVYALQVPFKELHSIELDRELYEDALRRFGGNDRIWLWHGDVLKVLPEIIDPKRYTTFYLDAHTDEQTPLLDELKIIFSYKWKRKPKIVMDDYRYFGQKKWPSLAEACWLVPGGYVISVYDDRVFCMPHDK